MKIQCSYCGNMINDTDEKCPNCGAPNVNVKRTYSGQPQTIEALKQWYSDRGLPPYETTRFFIGQDYRKPRAFGIYKDEKSGNFIVYKNKDNGQRAVRYEGTDEAYAVNELFQRLKQEIIEQKRNNLNNNNASSNTRSFGGENSSKSNSSKLGKTLITFFAGIFILIAAVIPFVKNLVTEVSDGLGPNKGYYDYCGDIYYYSYEDYNGNYWFKFDSGSKEWSASVSNYDMPNELETRGSSKKYFISAEWDSGINCTDFAKSIFAADMAVGVNSKGGYYLYDGRYYHHLSGYVDEYWYVYENGEWKEINYSALPYELQHSSIASGYFVCETFNASLPVSDFQNTIYYQDYLAPHMIAQGYYLIDNIYYYHNSDYYGSGWYSYDDDYGWSAVDEYNHSEQLDHPSTVSDFYYTPTWDSSTQCTDFESTEFYTQSQENSGSFWDNFESDSSYDWSSSDSWSSSSSDWDSDW